MSHSAREARRKDNNMMASLYICGICVGGIELDQIAVPHTKPGTTLSYDDIVFRKLSSPAAQEEITTLVRIHLGLPRSVRIRHSISKTTKRRWTVVCYTGRDTYLCAVKVRITL